MYVLGFPHFKTLLSLGVASTTKSAALAAKSTTTSYVCQLSGVHPLQPCRSIHQSLDPVGPESQPTSSVLAGDFEVEFHLGISVDLNHHCSRLNNKMSVHTKSQFLLLQPAFVFVKSQWNPHCSTGRSFLVSLSSGRSRRGKGWRSDPPEVAVHA